MTNYTDEVDLVKSDAAVEARVRTQIAEALKAWPAEQRELHGWSTAMTETAKVIVREIMPVIEGQAGEDQ